MKTLRDPTSSPAPIDELPMRVLIADDHTLVRAGLRSLLQSMQGVEVVAEALNGVEAERLARELRPDVVLMDIAMSEMNGLDAAERIQKSSRRTKVIILSMHSAGEYVSRAMQIGVAGYLIKDAAPLELELALRAVVRGENYLSPVVAKHVMGSLGGRSSEEHVGPEWLTPRQLEILKLIAKGHTTKQISMILDIRQKTVETHRTQLMERLKIHDLAGLVRFAIRNGIISADE